MDVQITHVMPRGCCDPESFIYGQRRLNGNSRPPADNSNLPKVEFTYIYRCETCGQRWSVKYEPPHSHGTSNPYIRTERVGKTSRRYRKRIARQILRQGGV